MKNGNFYVLTKWLLLSLFFVHGYSSSGESEIIWTGFIDKEKQYSVNDIIRGNTPLKVLKDDVFNFGLTKSNCWIFTEVSPDTYWHIVLDNPLLSRIDFYIIQGDSIIKEVHTGSSLPVSTRDQDFPGFLFRAPPQENCKLVFKIESTYPLVVPIEIIKGPQINSYLINHQRIGLLVLGLLTALTIVYIMISVSLKERTYYYYSVYAFTITLNIARANGQMGHWMFPFYSDISQYSTIFDILPTITIGLFFLHFLRIKKYYPVIYQVVIGMIWLQVASGIIVFIGYSQVSLIITYTVAITFIPLALIVTFLVYRYRYYSPAMYYFVASIFLFTSTVILIARNNGISIDALIPAIDIFQICIAAEMIVLALGASRRIETLKTDNLNIQKENLRITHNQKSRLRQLVKEQTEEMDEQNRELMQTIERLKITQSQLIESEKSAILGLLTAGLSHEINNPLNYIKGSSSSIKKNLKEIISLESELDKLISTFDHANPSVITQKLKEFENKKNGLNYSDLLKETNDLLLSINTGTDKISEIIYFLRVFSSDDEEKLKHTDLENKIDATLSLLKYKFKDYITIERDFSMIPNIECNPRKIGQVFMSLILNAIEAVEDKGIIIIKTWEKNRKIFFSIHDNGKGIPKDKISKIFDPFYSTKDPAGTGLGLSIVRAIIKEHHGTINFESEPGNTVITVELPFEQP